MMVRIHRMASVFGTIVVSATVPLFAASAARAECGWSLNGMYNFYQDNGFTVTFNIKQAGSRLGGDGSYARDSGSKLVAGPIDGGINGNRFSFNTSWGSVYEGIISDNGSLSGITHDSHGYGKTGWNEYYGKKADCLTTALAPPSSAPAQGPEISDFRSLRF